MSRKVFLVIGAIFLAFQSYKLIMMIEQVTLDSWWLIILVAFLLNLFILGVFAFLGFALSTQILLPSSYYKVYSPRILKETYRLFRVDLFRKFLLATVWRKKKSQKRYFNGRADGIQNLITQSKKSEFGHLIPFVLISILSIYYISTGLIRLGAITFLFNWLANWYPVILQRHHRMRIARILKK